MKLFDKRVSQHKAEEDMLRIIWEAGEITLEGIMCELPDYGKSSIQNRISKLRKAKLIHVANWSRGRSGPPKPTYCAGSYPDAPMIDPYKKEEVNKRYRASKKHKQTRKRWIKSAQGKLSMRKYEETKKTKRALKEGTLLEKDPLMFIFCARPINNQSVRTQ